MEAAARRGAFNKADGCGGCCGMPRLTELGVGQAGATGGGVAGLGSGEIRARHCSSLVDWWSEGKSVVWSLNDTEEAAQTSAPFVGTPALGRVAAHSPGC